MSGDIRITTNDESIVSFWKERGFDATLKYEAEGISCWDIEVPDDHEDLKSPDYLDLCIQEKMMMPALIRRRLQPPVYTAKSGGHFALVRLQNEQDLGSLVPMSRSKELLEFAATNPTTGECPDIVPIKDIKQIKRLLNRAHKSGAAGVLCFVTGRFTETISMGEAVKSLEQTIH